MTFAKHCLELAEKATPGDWHVDSGYIFSKNAGAVTTDGDCSCCMNKNKSNDAAFIAQSRTLVPELARRLEAAVEILRKYDSPTMDDFADSLEAMPEVRG